MLEMVAPGVGLRNVTMSPFFGPKIGEDQNKEKGLRLEIIEFLVQMGLETKQNEKTRSSPQISGVMVSHHNMVSSQMLSSQMVSHQNGVTRGGPPPSDATAFAPMTLPMALAMIVEICLPFRYNTVL